MDLPVALGSHRLGQDLDSAEDLGLLKLQVQAWKSWPALRERIAKATRFLVPVIRSDDKVPRDIVLLMVTATDGVTLLGKTTEIKVYVFDALRRQSVADRLAKNAAVCWLGSRVRP